MSTEKYQQLTALESEWAKDYSKRYSGGKNALSGFYFQIEVFLLRIVEYWDELDLSSKSDHYPLSIKMEALSDLVKLKDKVVISTQVKKTLSSSTLKDSVEEFLTILKVAKKISSPIVKEIKFVVLASRSISKVDKKAIDKIIDKFNDFDSDLLAQLKEKIYIEIDSDPNKKLISLLSNKFNIGAPFSIVAKWRGLVLMASSNSWGFDVVALEIWQDLNKTAKEAKNYNVYFWQDFDRNPANVSRGTVLTGQRPKVSHLREGFFFERISIYKNLYSDFERFAERINGQDNSKIPCFWISGRSGSGKSVSMLFLLSHIYEKFGNQVIYCAQFTKRINDISKYLSCNTVSTDGKIIVSFDDPYLPSIKEDLKYEWKDELAKILLLKERGEIEFLPIFILCGPTEYGLKFKEEFYEELDTTTIKLPDFAKSEQGHLEKWYKQRTGNDISLGYESNMLFVQAVFELGASGVTLDDFSRRLKERLIGCSENLFRCISRVIALNRIYIGYLRDGIEQVLSANEKEALKILEDEYHFGEIGQGGKSGYWLLHPHLANHFFVNWYGVKEEEVKELLLDSVLSTITLGGEPSEKTAPIWTLNSLIAERDYERYSRSIIEWVLNKVVAKNLEKKDVSIYLIPPLIESVINLRAPSSIAFSMIENIHSFDVNQKGMRLTLHKLIQHFDYFSPEERLKIQQSIRSLLSSNLNWKEWGSVFLDYLSRDSGDAAIDIYISHISNKQDEAFLLDLKIIKTWSNEVKIEKIVKELFQQRKPRVAYLEFLECVAESNRLNPDFLQPLISWLAEKVKETDRTAFLLSKLYYLFKGDELAKLCSSWLRMWFESSLAPYIAEPIVENLKLNVENKDLLKKVIRVSKADMSYLLQKLMRNGYFEDFSQNILDFLISENTNLGWYFVWQELIRDNKIIEKKQKIEISIAWLVRNLDCGKGSWGNVWKYCVSNVGLTAQLKTLGFSFLSNGAIKGGSYSKPIEILEKEFAGAKVLRRASEVLFLDTELESKYWLINFEHIVKNKVFNSSICLRVLDWLEVNRETKDYSFVLLRALDLSFSDKEYFNRIYNELRIGIRKISNSDRNWYPLWKKLFFIEPNDELVELCLNWILESGINLHIKVLCSLLSNSKNKSVNKYSKDWLMNSQNMNDEFWPSFYFVALREIKDHKDLMEFGIEWLKRSNSRGENFAKVWLATAEYDSSEIVMRLSINYLFIENFHSRYWISVFIKAFDFIIVDSKLYQKGFLAFQYSKGFSSKSWAHLFYKFLANGSIKVHSIDWMEKRAKIVKNHEVRLKIVESCKKIRIDK